MKLLAERLRKAWPEVRIVVRADSGFRRSRLPAWCERNSVGCIIGLARNPCLAERTAEEMADMKGEFQRTGEKQRRLVEFACSTLKSWSRERRAVSRLEHGPLGPNPRCVATSLPDADLAAPATALLRPGGNGEPDQGAAAAPVRGPHFLPPVAAGPVPPAPYPPSPAS